MSDDTPSLPPRLDQWLDGTLSTTSGEVPQTFDSPAPDPEIQQSGPFQGQHKSYWVLSESERAKGFIRPVRTSYIHVGIAGPKYPLSDTTEEEKRQYDGFGWVKYEAYPEGSPENPDGTCLGRYWTQQQLDSIGKGCGSVTTMGRALAETYARQPNFYGRTMCVRCGGHYPVGKDGEFIWDDGSGERVGT